MRAHHRDRADAHHGDRQRLHVRKGRHRRSRPVREQRLHGLGLAGPVFGASAKAAALSRGDPGLGSWWTVF